MTTEKQPIAAQEDFEIVDTTLPEVEAAIEEGMAASRAERADTPAPSTEVATPSQVTEPPVATSQEPPAEPPKAEPPPKRTYSEDEWAKLRRATAERENALQKELEQYRQRQSELALESQVEATRRQMAEAYKAQGYDPQQAESFAQAVAQEKRQALLAQAQVQSLQARYSQTQSEAEQAAKLATAQIIAKENNLTPDQQRILLTVNDPQGMVMLAQELAKVRKIESEAVAAKKASVPPVKVEGGSPAASPVNRAEERDARIMNGTATEDDWRDYAKTRFR